MEATESIMIMKLKKELCSFMSKLKHKDVIGKFEGKRMTPEHAKHLKRLVKVASRVDKRFSIFGSSQHRYRLNPTLSLDQIRRLEEYFGFQLTEESVFFLTQVGNGGAGPYYGINNLETMIKRNLRPDLLGEEAYIVNILDKDKWYKFIEQYEEADDSDHDTFEERLYSGFLILGTQ